MYVCMYMFVTLWFPRSVYALKCSTYSGMCGSHARLSFVKTPEQQGWEPLVVCCEEYQQRHIGKCADTWYKLIESTETVELCWPGHLPLCLCETTNGLTVLLFCDIHIDIGTTLNLLCLHVSCWMLSHTMWRHHWHYCLIIICKSYVIELYIVTI